MWIRSDSSGERSGAVKQLMKVPGRYRALFEHIFGEYADPVRSIDHEKRGAVVLQVVFDRGETQCWHYLSDGEREITEGEPRGDAPVALRVRVDAERLRTAMESGKSIRDVFFACTPEVHGDIDFAFRVLAAAEKVRARYRKGA